MLRWGERRKLMNKHEIIEKKQKEFNDYTMEFADKIEYDLDLGFTPAQLDKYLCREYTPFVRDTIRFAMLFSPSAEKVDKLIELLTKENGKISNVGKIFKAYIIDDPEEIYNRFMESTKKYEITEKDKNGNHKRLSKRLLKAKHTKNVMPEGLDIGMYIIDKITKKKITDEQVEMVAKGLLFGVSAEMIYDTVEKNTLPKNMRQVFAIQIVQNGIKKWKI